MGSVPDFVIDVLGFRFDIGEGRKFLVLEVGLGSDDEGEGGYF